LSWLCARAVSAVSSCLPSLLTTLHLCIHCCCCDVFSFFLFFFFQAEDGIRDFHVTGVQTCALPIYHRRGRPDGGQGPQQGRCAGDRRQRACREQKAAARRRDRHGEDRTLGRLRPARHRGGILRNTAPEIGRASCRGRVEYRGGEREW